MIFLVIFAIMFFPYFRSRDFLSGQNKSSLHRHPAVSSRCGEDDVRIAALCLWVDDHAAGTTCGQFGLWPLALNQSLHLSHTFRGE